MGHGVEAGVIRLRVEDDVMAGDSVVVDGKRLINFGKNISCCLKFVGQGLAHADLLATLARKCEGYTHGVSSYDSFKIFD